MTNLIINATTTTLYGIQNYDIVQIINGGILYVTPYNGTANTGTLEIHATSISVDATSQIVADTRGFRGGDSGVNDGEGTGHGLDGGVAGSGAGYGGAGGDTSHSGGIAYGTYDELDIERGSGGACSNYYSSYGKGGNGGGALALYANTITINGTISSNGEAGTTGSGQHGSGGGSGGGILINGSSVIISGIIRSNGGIGSNGELYTRYGGGGGAGGRIKILYRTINITGSTITANGASGGTGNGGASDGLSGMNGTILNVPSWLTGWYRRKLITVTGSTAGIQTDYQMKLIAHKTTGTDTSTDIYLGNNVKNDFSDLRFTLNNGSTLLSYCIESYTSGSVATVWIKIPSIPANPYTKTIYAYYDNSGVSASSSGTNTFIFFDDFEDGVYTDKWDQLSKNTYSLLAETGGYLVLGSTHGGGASTSSGASVRNKTPDIGDGVQYIFKVTLNSPYELWEHQYFDFNGTGQTRNRSYCGSEPIYCANDCYELYIGPTELDLYNITSGTSTTVGTVTGLSISTVYIKVTYLIPNIIVYTSTDEVTWTQRISWSGATTLKTGKITIYDQGCGDRNGSINYYNIEVCKYTSPEPTFSTIGTEEILCNAPSANLIVLEIVSNQLLRQYPSYIDLDAISNLIITNTEQNY